MYNSLAQSPSSDLWDAHGYHMAVDQDPATCWNSFHCKCQNDPKRLGQGTNSNMLLEDPKSGTYFGLLLMGNLDMKSVDIMTRNDIRQAEDLFEVSVTSNGTQWVRKPKTSKIFEKKRNSLFLSPSSRKPVVLQRPRRGKVPQQSSTLNLNAAMWLPGLFVSALQEIKVNLSTSVV